MALDQRALSGREVRLFPSHHIKSVREAELRATASFLAVARAVSEFGKTVVSIGRGPGGKLGCYTEVPFKVQDGAKPRKEQPDGLLRVTWGKKHWTALIEVKVGNNFIEQEQFDRYHSMAGDHGINALITISNQSALPNGLPPGLTVSKLLLKKVPVVHLSWERLLSEAQLLSRRKAVADPDQQWILEEWIRYLADPQSRIIEPPEIGEDWSEILRCAREGNLSACKSQLHDTVQRWDAFLRKVALRLRAKLGVNVVLKISKSESHDPALHIKNLHSIAVNDGQLPGAFRIPDAAGDLSVVVLLASRSVQYSVEVKAPTEGKTIARIKWMLKQLVSEEVPDDLVVQVHWGWGLSSQARIKDLKEQIDSLLWDSNGQKVPQEALPRSFSLKWTIALPKGKGRSTAPVLEGIAEGGDDFYKRVVEGLRPFVPKAPRLRPEEPEKLETSDVDSAERAPGEAEASTTTQPAVEGEKARQAEMAPQEEGNTN